MTIDCVFRMDLIFLLNLMRSFDLSVKSLKILRFGEDRPDIHGHTLLRGGSNPKFCWSGQRFGTTHIIKSAKTINSEGINDFSDSQQSLPLWDLLVQGGARRSSSFSRELNTLAPWLPFQWRGPVILPRLAFWIPFWRPICAPLSRTRLRPRYLTSLPLQSRRSHLALALALALAFTCRFFLHPYIA